MELKQQVLENVSKELKRTIGMTYEEYAKLDCDEQQRLLFEYRKKHKKKNDKYVPVMIGYGNNSIFVNVKKGDEVMIRYGNTIEAGLTIEEERQRIEDDLDNILYSKPIALVKKIKRRIKIR